MIIYENRRILAPLWIVAVNFLCGRRWGAGSRRKLLPRCFIHIPTPFTVNLLHFLIFSFKTHRSAEIPFLPLGLPKCQHLPFFQPPSTFYFFIQHFLPYLPLYNISSHLNYQTNLHTSHSLFSPFSSKFCRFPKAQEFYSKGLYKLQGDCLSAHNIKQKMFSSGGRAPACKHDIKTMMQRIDSDRHTALNSHRVEARGNLHMGSPYKNATPGRTHSKSRQKKLSANKLFSKAHQISDNETYLTHSKSNEPYHAKQTRSNSGHCSDCLHSKKTKVLELCQQYNIKVGGEVDNNTLSLIIEKYGFYGITIDDLSSIHQNSDDSTLTSQNTSLIDLIVKS